MVYLTEASLHVQIPPLVRKSLYMNVLSVCPPIKLCVLSAGLREQTSLSSVNPQPFVVSAHAFLQRCGLNVSVLKIM